MQPPVYLHRASWLLPMAGAMLPDGAVAVQGGTIVGCGRFKELQQNFAGTLVVDHPDCALMPGLINGHMHLELSHLAHLSHGPPAESFTGWIAGMLTEREALGVVGPHVEDAALNQLQAQHDSGVIALADIGNTPIARQLVGKVPSLLFPFLEYLGLTRASLVPALKKLAKTEDDVACTAHAPYSTHPELIRALKKRADQFGHLFPIHVAEPVAEQEMLCEGKGELVDFLRQRGFYDDSFQSAAIDIEGSVQYLHEIGVLNSRTLCVHAVHVSNDEILLLKKKQATVCLCPGSNRFVQVGRAPGAAYLQSGLLPAIGTDSVASNPEVSIWREMQLLAEDHPEVSPDDILKMATLGGAAALGIQTRYGTLAPGKSGCFLSVPVPDEAKDGQEICAALVHGGSGQKPQWVKT